MRALHDASDGDLQRPYHTRSPYSDLSPLLARFDLYQTIQSSKVAPFCAKIDVLGRRWFSLMKGAISFNLELVVPLPYREMPLYHSPPRMHSSSPVLRVRGLRLPSGVRFRFGYPLSSCTHRLERSYAPLTKRPRLFRTLGLHANCSGSLANTHSVAKERRRHHSQWASNSAP